VTAPITANGRGPAAHLDLRAEARQAWLEGAAEGMPPSGAELGRRFGRSPQWGRMVAADIRRAHVDARRVADLEVPATEPPGASVAPAKAGLAPPSEDVAPPGAEVAERHWADTAVVLVVALVAAAASYGHMLHVAHLAGEPLWLARAFPLTVDGLALAALRRGDAGRRWLALALAVSVAANIGAQFPQYAAAAGPLVSAWPPLALFGTHRLLHRR
jgi:hypothetical protein